jgi:hypothetical protein
MDSGGGAGDVGDVDRAAGQHELRGASRGHGDLVTTQGHLSTPPSPRRFPSVYPLHTYPAPVTHMRSADSSQPSGLGRRLCSKAVVFPALPLPVLVNLPVSWLHVAPVLPCSC